MKWMQVLKLWHWQWSGGQTVQEGILIAASESRRECTLPVKAEMWETRSPGFCSTSDSIRGTRQHPTLFKNLHLQQTSASTANVLLLGSGTHWDDASNQAIKRLLSLPSEAEVVAELVVASGKGHRLKMILIEKNKMSTESSSIQIIRSEVTGKIRTG